MKAIVIGIGATLLMDAWNLLLRRALGVKSLDMCTLGRLVVRRHECLVGWVGHYTIGVVLAAAFVLLMPAWLDRPALIPAMMFGAVTVVFPIFILQPALGIDSAKARLKSMGTHLVYGLGLFFSAEMLRLLLR